MKKKHRYGTVVVNLKNNRVIAIVPSRETEDVQAILDTFPNLKYLSRDRGKQYQKLSNNYIHIADRFHILKNLTERLIKERARIIPSRVIFQKSLDKNNSETENVTLESDLLKGPKTIAHKNKIDLIMQVREEYKRSTNILATSRLFKIDRRTVRKYIKMNNVCEEAIYDRSSRTSKLDLYKDIILDIYNPYIKITKLQKKLLEKGIDVNYCTLKYYINKHCYQCNKENIENNISKIVIKRRDIINKVFNWENTDENIWMNLKNYIQ